VKLDSVVSLAYEMLDERDATIEEILALLSAALRYVPRWNRLQGEIETYLEKNAGKGMSDDC